MKKLLVMLLAVTAAGLTYAAQADWTFTGSTDIEGSSLYITLAQIDDGADIADITGTGNYVSKVDSLELNRRGTATVADGVALNLSGDNNEDRSLFFYVVNGDQYYYAGSQTGKQYVSGEGSGVPVEVTNDSIPAPGGTGWDSPVPEPSSIALLTLGLVAIGLKRKVA